MAKIFIIEDDVFLRKELALALEKRGHISLMASSFENLVDRTLEIRSDLVILDINLPGKSGFEICRQLKAKASFPVLILTSRDKLSDELHALDLGADDYLTKPCPLDRLLARVELLLRNYGKIRNILQAGSLILDTDTYKVLWKDKQKILPETEGKILKVLLENHPETVTKEDLILSVWGESDFLDENILQVNMTRLRAGLDHLGIRSLLITVRNEGYRLEV